MFIIDSLMISGIRWVLDTTLTAAEAEMNDDTALREQLLEAEMRREMGEISDEAFAVTEADLLARIREIKGRREGTGPLALGAEPMEASPGKTFQVEAELSGDFHDPRDRAETTVIAVTPTSVEEVVVSPGNRSGRSVRGSRSGRSSDARGAAGTARRIGTARTTRRTRTSKA